MRWPSRFRTTRDLRRVSGDSETFSSDFPTVAHSHLGPLPGMCDRHERAVVRGGIFRFGKYCGKHIRTIST
jgi:hypothetical protein